MILRHRIANFDSVHLSPLLPPLIGDRGPTDRFSNWDPNPNPNRNFDLWRWPLDES